MRPRASPRERAVTATRTRQRYSGCVLLPITSRTSGLIVGSCVGGFGAFTVLFGISRSLILSMIALMLVGCMDMVSVVVRSTLVQLATPDEMRGRVSAVEMIFIGASNEIGQFESGLTAQWFGAIPSVVLGGVGTILVVALWAWRFPKLRRVDELHDAAP